MTTPVPDVDALMVSDAFPLPTRSTRRAADGVRPARRQGRYVDPSVSCLIATLPRSGSWLLSEALFNTGVAGEAHEFFRPDFTATWAQTWGIPADDSDYGAFVAAARRCTSTPNGVFSAKLHWYQFCWLHDRLAHAHPGASAGNAELEQWFPGLRFVFLSRRDSARQAISYYRATRTQQWFARKSDLPQRPVFDFQQIRWLEDVLMLQSRQWQDFFETAGISPLEIVYEDFVNGYAETVEAVLRFIEVDPPPGTLPGPTLSRQADDVTEQILEDYHAVRTGLIGYSPDVVWNNVTNQFEKAAHTKHPG